MQSVALKNHSFPHIHVYMYFFLGFDVKNSLLMFVQEF